MLPCETILPSAGSALLSLAFEQAADPVDADVHQHADHAGRSARPACAPPAPCVMQANTAPRVSSTASPSVPYWPTFCSIQPSQCSSFSSSNRKLRNTSSRKAPPKADTSAWWSVRWREYSAGVLIAMCPDVDQAKPGGGGDDHQRKQQAHAEHRHQDADGEEQFAPERVPMAQHGGVDHRVVERQRHFQHAEHRRDPQRLQQAGARRRGRSPTSRPAP